MVITIVALTAIAVGSRASGILDGVKNILGSSTVETVEKAPAPLDLKGQQITRALKDGDMVTFTGPDGSTMFLGKVGPGSLSVIMFNKDGRALMVRQVGSVLSDDVLRTAVQAVLVAGYEPVSHCRRANEIKPFAR